MTPRSAALAFALACAPACTNDYGGLRYARGSAPATVDATDEPDGGAATDAGEPDAAD